MVERRPFRHSEPLGRARDADWWAAPGAGDPRGRGSSDHWSPQDPLRPESQRAPAVVETSAGTPPWAYGLPDFPATWMLTVAPPQKGLFGSGPQLTHADSKTWVSWGPDPNNPFWD